MTRLRHALFVTVAAVCLGAITACGGDDDTSAAPDSDPAATGSTADPSASDSSDSGDDGGEVGARVTIGDTTYTATNERVCVQLGGAVGATFFDDAGVVTIDVNVPPEDYLTDNTESWDPPGVRVDDGDEAQWVAGFDEIDFADSPRVSSIESFRIDGDTVSGEAIFVETFAQSAGDAQTVAGTFEMTCES